MSQKKFVRMWVEENYNYYELLPTVMNYGPGMAWGIPARDVIAYARDFHAELYLNENEFKYFADKGYDFFIKADGLKQVLSRLEKDIPLVTITMQRLISLDLASLDNTHFFQEYLNYVRPYGNLMKSYIITQPHFVAKIEHELKASLSKFDNADELFSTLTSASVEFEFSQKGSIFEKSFAELLKSEDAKLDMTILEEPLYKEKLVDETKRKNIIKENSLSDDIVRLGNTLAGIGEIRMKMRLIWMPVIYYMELFLIELKRRYGLTKATIRKYDSAEFDELIRIGQIVEESVLNKRLTGFAKVLSGGEVKTLVGQESNAFIENINNAEKGVEEIRGMVASKGVAKGKVVVLSYTKSEEHARKINSMGEGDILVSEMTRPNIIPACKKAGAIITDEGGITCHAAIVSREMKKPCIIGTKIATKVLKDGDLVEVNAERGIVRIIERNKNGR